MAKITRIEPQIPALPTRKKVAAYARVSMETERLHHSLSSQVSYYSELIQNNPEWEYVGVYADEGITGTIATKRDEFQHLIADCDAGKIDIVLCKSISRFARNTVDLLNTVRHLKELGISVRFEKEHIDSLSDDGELMLTLLASFAQSESESISHNVKWGVRKRMEQGIPNGHFRVFGYRWEGDQLVIVPEEAAIVKRIYQNFLNGKSRLETEREFAAEGITTREGCRWVDSNIKVVLSNVTYTGNMLLQKEYISDPITKKRRKNHGELPQYYIENTHEPIIDMETFQFVQSEMARRRELGALANKSLNTCCFTGKIKCPHCGLSYMHNRRTKNSNYQEYWNCGSKKKKKVGDGCPVGGTISHKSLLKACCEVLNLEEFDEEVFLDKVDRIEVPEKYTLDFFLKDGTVVRKAAPNTGHQDCWTPEYRAKVSAKRKKTGTNPKGASCFTSKIKCVHCGTNFRRCTQPSRDGKSFYWRCPTGNKPCETTGMREERLQALASEVLGLNEFDAAAFSEQIDHIDVLPGMELEFHFKDGRKETRSYDTTRVSHPCSESQKNHMREVMKKKWTPERRTAMSEKIKKIRSEKHWASTKAKKVKTIPATLSRFTASPITEQKKRRVAGYARVSTDHDDQFTSYEAQIDYYTNYIRSRDDWEFVNVYTDEGITGTSTKHREGFKKMVADALAGNIDLIVTKSVSRFARNTVDSLTTIRKLKEHGVECYFEKENIWTFDGKGELLITIMSSLAQEESRSISENCTWGQRKRFADGKVTIPFNRFLGYDRGANGELIVNPEQAETVRSIYDMFLQGLTYNGIAKALTAKGIKTPGGKDKWSISTVRSILSNEKYKGDALLQKRFTVDYLTKKQKKNEGEIPQYYVEGNHEAIIPPEKFDMVQREMAKRGKGKKYHSGVHPFSSKIKCGQCGSWYGSKVWHSTDKYRRTIWQCNHKYDGGERCSTPHLTDEQIQDAFLSAANKLLATKDAVIANGKAMLTLLFDTSEQEAERDKLLEEAQVVSDAVQKNIYENAHVALDQKAYQKKYDGLTGRYETLKTRIEELNDQISQLQSQKGSYEDFLRAFKKLPDQITEFSLDSFNGLVDFITVNTADDIQVTFRNGQTIKA